MYKISSGSIVNLLGFLFSIASASVNSQSVTQNSFSFYQISITKSCLFPSPVSSSPIKLKNLRSCGRNYN